MSVKLPQIGDVIQSPHSKFKDLNGDDLFDQLPCDGSTFDELIYVDLYAALGSTTLPNLTDKDARTPYMIIADLTA